MDPLFVFKSISQLNIKHKELVCLFIDYVWEIFGNNPDWNEVMNDIKTGKDCLLYIKTNGNHEFLEYIGELISEYICNPNKFILFGLDLCKYIIDEFGVKYDVNDVIDDLKVASECQLFDIIKDNVLWDYSAKLISKYITDINISGITPKIKKCSNINWGKNSQVSKNDIIGMKVKISGNHPNIGCTNVDNNELKQSVINNEYIHINNKYNNIKTPLALVCINDININIDNPTKTNSDYNIANELVIVYYEHNN
mmetsp:Transcript_106107/g.129422  ORF Transcript_106107/g.129422 Transcript_106107/m.129422 type:complete len:254 (+) Transcript_106107:83-844(+)